MKHKKRTNHAKTQKVKPNNYKDVKNSDDSDADDQFDPNESYSDSDDQSDGNETLYINPKRKKFAESESEVEEVLPLTDDEEKISVDDEKSSSDADSEDGLPNVDAWGRKKSVYYNADFVDEDRGRTYREEDDEAAKAEEADALAIQKKFLDSVESSVFDAFPFAQVKETFEDEKLEDATPDWNAISKTEKLKILNKNCPEFSIIVEEFSEKLEELKKLPFLDSVNKNDFSENYYKFYTLKLQLLLHYCMNMSFYMMLKSRCVSVTDHPVMNKLSVYRTLLNLVDNLDSKLDFAVDNQQNKENTADINFTSEITEETNLVSGHQKRKSKSKKSNALLGIETEAEKEIIEMYRKMKEKQKESEGNNAVEKTIGSEDEEISEEKRTVTYQIAKNKGIVPHRKKEYRNPRVRHRMKYRKAKIRRKGQVREPKHETQRYGGEFSGIHANVTRSIKIK